MKNEKKSARTNTSHEGQAGRIFKEQSGGKHKGHDLLNSNSDTDGVGTEIKSPADAQARTR